METFKLLDALQTHLPCGATHKRAVDNSGRNWYKRRRHSGTHLARPHNVSCCKCHYVIHSKYVGIVLIFIFRKLD